MFVGTVPVADVVLLLNASVDVIALYTPPAVPSAILVVTATPSRFRPVCRGG